MSDEKPKARTNSWIWVRLGMVYVSFLLFIVAVALRLIQLQVLPNQTLDRLSEKQFKSQSKSETVRTTIYDRNGQELAVSVRSLSLFAHPRRVRNKGKAAQILARYLKGSPTYWKKRLSTTRDFVWLKRQVDEEVGKKLLSHKIVGIKGRIEPKRVYPLGKFAANLIGFSGIDGDGLAGLELSEDTRIKIVNDSAKWSVDGRGLPTYIETIAQNSRPKGLYTSIDRTLQYVLEDELQRAAKETNAKGVMGIVMDPYTGEILAMGQTPSFDPNAIEHSNPKNFSSWSVSHLYEPGSTMKVLLAAEALERSLMKGSTPIDCEGGAFRIKRTTIREAEGHQFKVIPLSDVIKFSSNIGAVKIARMLGVTRTQGALQRFGLNKKTGIGLPAEAHPSIPSNWTPLRLANVGFGQGFSVTPLHMVRAFAVFANGGYLVEPTLLRGQRGEIRRVLSTKTSQQIREMLRSVVEEEGGTGRAARIPGVAAAGKTGTAQKYVAGEGYLGGKYFSSFVGFVPAERPQLVIGIMVDEPEGKYYASEVAAPAFGRIAEKSLKAIEKVPRNRYVPPKIEQLEPFNPKPQIMVEYRGNHIVMPDLKGLSVREVARLLGSQFQNAQWKGHGYLVEQYPKPGTVVSKGARVRFQFDLG